MHIPIMFTYVCVYIKVYVYMYIKTYILYINAYA